VLPGELARAAMGDRPLAVGVEEDAVVGDREQARQLMAHEHHRRAGAMPDVVDQVVEPSRGDRVQAGRGLVVEQERWLGRDRTGQAGALLHAAAQRRRIEVRELAQLDPFEHLARFGVALLRIEPGLAGERQADVLEHGHRRPECGALEQHAEARTQRAALVVVAGPEIDAVVGHRAAGRRQQAHHVLEQRALAAAAAAHDGEDAALLDLQRHLLLDQAIAEAHQESVDREKAHVQMSSALAHRAKMASSTMMPTMLVTTAPVVATPTPAALRLACRP